MMVRSYLTCSLIVLALLTGLVKADDASARSNIEPRVDEILNEFGQVRVLVVMRPPEPAQPESFAYSHPARFVRNLLGPHGEKVRRLAKLPIAVAKMDRDRIEFLRDNPLVKAVFVDEPQKVLLDTSIPELRVGSMHHEGRGRDDVSVAVLDTGVNYHHDFLKGKLRAEGCFSTTDTGPDWTADTLCGNGLDMDVTTGSGLNCVGLRGCGHGTHVAGIAVGADGVVGEKVLSGVAPDAGLISIQVFSRIKSTRLCGSEVPCILTFPSDQVEALEHVRWLAEIEGHKIAAVNMSLGDDKGYERKCDDSSVLTGSIERLREMGIATVIASGNDAYHNAVSRPGCISSAITVGASKRKGIKPNIDLSNLASMVDFVAPGTEILSASINGYSRRSGTSMAAPHVAGLVALLRSHVPHATIEQIELSIRKTARPAEDPRTGWRFPFPDGNKAVLELQRMAGRADPGTDGGRKLANGLDMAELSHAHRIIVVPEKWVWADAGTQEIARRIARSLGPQTRVSPLGRIGFVAQNNRGFDSFLLEQLLSDLGSNTRIFKDELSGIQ